MIQQKYVSSLDTLKDVYTKSYININNNIKNRLKTVYLINIIDSFLTRYLFFNKDTLKINAASLKAIYGYNYNNYIDYLVKNEFIFLYKNYSAGLRSRTYKLTDKAKQIKYLTNNIDLSDKTIDKINDINTSYNNISETIKKKLINDLYKLDIDYDMANEWINKHINKDEKANFINIACINKIKNKDLYYSFDNYGRFHTNFTVLKKEVRDRYLSIDSNKIKEIDITNSQPFFLYVLMKESNFSDWNNFDKDVLSGKIYEKFIEASDSGLTRKQVKVNIYSVLFGRNTIKNYWNDLFESLYPEVYQWIKEYKSKMKSYKSIARKLQSIESDFMFNKLIPELLEYNYNMPIITIHDSIIIPKSDYESVKKIFIKKLNSLI